MIGMEIIFVYITNPTQAWARKIAAHLIDKKLIACANMFPIESVYRGKGKMVQEKEWVMIGKTTDGNYAGTKREVEKIHPYEVPCVIKIPVQANTAYAAWLKKETTKKVGR